MIILTADSKPISVKDTAEETIDSDIIAFCVLDINLSDIIKRIAFSRTLPEIDNLSLRKLGEFIMEGIRLQIDISRTLEIGEKNDMLKVLISEAVFASDIE